VGGGAVVTPARRQGNPGAGGDVQGSVVMFRVAGAALCLVVFAACGRGAAPGGPGQGSTGDLDGRTFLSTGVTENGAPRPLVAGTRISIRFEAARLNANAGCNHLGGRYRVESGALVVDDLATTDMACVPATRMDQDTWLAAVLTGRPTIDLNGDALTLAGGGVEIAMKDRRTVDPDRPLTGPRWRVESIITGDAVSSTPQEAEAHFTFAADGRVTGSTGCNDFFGSYQAAGGMITFSGVGMTKKACQGAVNVLERAVTALFDGRPAPYRIEADQLTVTYSTGNGGLQLRAA